MPTTFAVQKGQYYDQLIATINGERVVLKLGQYYNQLVADVDGPDILAVANGLNYGEIVVQGDPSDSSGAEGTAFATTLLTGWYDNITPAAFYDAATTTTWFFWQDRPGGVGTDYNLHCRTYNHATANLSPDIIVAEDGLDDDNHGAPSAALGSDGHAYVAYGGHNTAEKLASTTYAGDPAQWTERTDQGSDHAYPHLSLVGSTMYLGTRVNSRSFYMTPQSMAAGVLTPATGVHCVDFGVSTRFYQGVHVVRTNDIHVCAIRSDGGDTERRNVYYFVVETDGAGTITGIRDFDDTTTILAASFPVDLTESDASFKIYTHPSGELWSGGPALCFDTNDHPHVAFSKGVDVNSVTDILHIWHNGTAWQAADTVRSDTPEIVGGLSIIPGASGKVEVWYYDDPSALFAAGGNMYRKVWEASSFGSAELIRTAGDGPLVAPSMVRDGVAALRTIYRAGSPDPAAYAHGDSGAFVFSETYTPTNAETVAYLARLSVQPVSDEKFWIDRLFSVVKEIGIAKFDALWLHCMGSEADGLLNILSTATPSVNFSAAFVADRGFETDGVATYVDLGFNPIADGVAFLQDSAHFGIVCLTNVGIATVPAGWIDTAAGDTHIVPRIVTSDDMNFRITQSVNSTVAGTFSLPSLVVVNRSASDATQCYRNGAAVTVSGSPNQTSGLSNDATFKLGHAGPTAYSAQEFAISIVGGSLTAGEHSTLYNKGILPLMQYKGLI